MNLNLTALRKANQQSAAHNPGGSSWVIIQLLDEIDQLQQLEECQGCGKPVSIGEYHPAGACAAWVRDH